MTRLLTLALVAVQLACPSPTNAHPNTRTHRGSPCNEDQACWNWTTMGNRQRGIVTREGGYAIVTTRSFCHYNDPQPRLPHDPYCK